MIGWGRGIILVKGGVSWGDVREGVNEVETGWRFLYER